MRIVFLDFGGLNFHVGTARQQALGGSQSAACYLAESFALRGHQVSLVSHATTSGIEQGVSCFSWQHLEPVIMRDWNIDAAIIIAATDRINLVRQVLGPRPRLILWTGHSYDQPSVQMLLDPIQRDAFDGFAMVSRWQAERYQQTFGMPAEKVGVLGNAVAASFRNMFGPDESICQQKSEPPILAYTSTPFRGLNVLLRMFPEIRRQVPDVRLQVFSDMKMYQVPGEEDQSKYGNLYALARSTPGVEFVGSVSQTVLAQALRNVFMLAYPNTFAETSCISLMEAMAAGCEVVTSEFGALPETSAGFAALIPTDPQIYLLEFIRQVVDKIHERKSDQTERRLRRQVEFVNREYTWEHRAQEWEIFLHKLVAATPTH